MGRCVVSSRWLRSVVSAVLVAGVVQFVPARARGQAVFQGTQSQGSVVRDATRVGSGPGAVITAVGTAWNPATGVPPSSPGGSDGIDAYDAAFWTFSGSATPALTRLPNDPSFSSLLATPGSAQVNAEAITPDGAFIAGQARTGSGNVPARYTVSGLGLLNFYAAPYPALVKRAQVAARTISDNGAVAYGRVAASVPVGAFTRTRFRTVRFDTVAGTTAYLNQPPKGWTDSDAQPVQQELLVRGASADGAVALGWNYSLDANTGIPFLNDRAFRYVQGGSPAVTNLPTLGGGTWNRPVALTNDGNTSVLVGNSTTFPNGEIYLHDATTSVVTALGSPNAAWRYLANTGAGVSDDAAVVVVTFGDANTGNRYAYLHNASGWFHLLTALAAAGVNLPDLGWQNLQVYGVSGDATLVFGFGIHNGVQEGFVAEFAPGFLKNFDVPATPPASTAIVGAWTDDPSNPHVAVAFMADGSYYEIDDGGFERGVYTWSAATGRFTLATRQDTNGDGGLSDDNGSASITVAVAGDVLTATQANCTTDCTTTVTRVKGGAGTIVGGWLVGDARVANASTVAIFFANGTYLLASDTDPSDGGALDGIEKGTYTWAPNGDLTATTIALDTNGTAGLSNPTGQSVFLLSRDELVAQAGDASGTRPAARIVDPASVVPAITSPLAVTADYGQPFTYTVTADHALTLGADGLPQGLSFDAGTGVISGTPTTLGPYAATLSAANSFGAITTATLALDVVSTATTSTGTNVTVAPAVPTGTAPVSVSFSNVTSGGTTTLEVVDPATAPPAQAVPSGFALSDPPVYYEVSTSASFTGNVTVCFNYGGTNAGAGTPQLFHFENNAWKNITTSVDPATTTICGTASSFSPFAVFVSPVTRTGFYAPVSQVAGFVNTAKAGSTVPLKFNVYVGGVEKTDTAGLAFSVGPIACTSTPEDPVDFVTTGGTSLRYDTTARQFVQNWQTPKSPGCYVVRMTTAADKLSITAIFKLK